MTKEELQVILADRKKSFAYFGGFTSTKPAVALEWVQKKLSAIDKIKENLMEASNLLKEIVAELGDEKLQKVADKYSEAELEAIIALKKNKK